MCETLKDVDGNAHAGLTPVVHVVATIVVFDVNVVGVAPADRPRINESKCVATIFKAPMFVVPPAYVEPVPTAKVGGVMVVGNTTMLVATPGSTHWR